MVGFIIWSIVGCIFICIGICGIFSKKAVGFWANAEMFTVTDIKKYNYAMAKLWCIFGFVLILLGIPLMEGQNSPWALFSAMGVMVEIITFMVVYVLVIEKKYKVKK